MNTLVSFTEGLFTMITYITALYPEAKPLIQALALKQKSTENHYSLFEGENCRLLVTGSGMMAAATSVARHFSLYPAAPKDIVINLSIAGYVPEDTSVAFRNSGCIQNPNYGNLFLVTKITEQMTGRTFYPDILYKNEFHKLPLTTVATPCSNASLFAPNSLVDMEASALYQALLPHVSPERMFFFKVVSDVLGSEYDTQGITAEQTYNLITTHVSKISSFAEHLSDVLSAAFFRNNAFTEEELALIQQIYAILPLTESTHREVQRLFRYVKLTGTDLAPLLQEFLLNFPDTAVRGKKQAAPYLKQLTELVLRKAPLRVDEASVSRRDSYLPFYHTVYAEKGGMDAKISALLPKDFIEIDHYKDVFNRSHQNFAEQKKAPSLIFAKKTGTLIYEGAPVCQSFGNKHFYYTSCMMNCIYHCDYCYLQGMYPCGHTVVFVNLEDYFRELEVLLEQHPVYLCVSYDTDLLALEQRFGFVKRWLAFAATHETLTLEIRTKSGNPAVFAELAKVYESFTDKADGTPLIDVSAAKGRIIFAWTVSPSCVISATEHGAASLELRLQALSAAKAAGFSVRLCFDPMIYHSGWKNSYSELVKSTFNYISPSDLYDVSIGVFRISTAYLKNMRKRRPDNAIVQFPYITENGVSHYGTLSEEMVHYVKELLLSYLPAEKIFEWNGGN